MQPIGGDHDVTIVEDCSYSFNLEDFPFTDSDSDSFAGIVVSSLPGSGQLRLNGVAIAAGTFIAASDIVAGNLTYSPAPEESGVGYASFAFRVRDSAGETDLTANVVTFNVTSFNDAPVVNAPVTQAGSEDVAVVFSAASGNAITISDVDAGSGTLLVYLTSTGYGALTLGSTAGLSSIYGDGTNQVVYSGHAGRDQPAIDGLTYQGPPNANGTSYLLVGVDDDGNSGGNLIVNGDAEAGTAATDYSSAMLPPGWTRVGGTGSLTAVEYAAAGSDPDQLNVGDSNVWGAGSDFFAGGPAGAPSAIMQLIDVSDRAAKIDANVMRAQISGLFGGYLSEDDSMTMTVRFLDANGSQLGNPVEVGGVEAGGRGNFTIIYPHSAYVGVPVGTRSIEVILSSNHVTGSYSNGYADNLQLTLSERVSSAVAINLAPTDDPGVARDDAFTTDEATVINVGSLFSNNGFGADTDIDNIYRISHVNGSAAAVGELIGLSSGASLTVNANGTFAYDPHGAFDFLADGEFSNRQFHLQLGRWEYGDRHGHDQRPHQLPADRHIGRRHPARR